MKKKSLTEEEVEQEIRELLADPDVKLARAENYLKYKHRQKLYTLRNLKKRGEAIRQDPDFSELVKEYEEEKK